MFEWLTLWPTRTPLPVNSQRRDMVDFLCAMPGTSGLAASSPGYSGTGT
jgi:hypothetical protein